MKMSSTGYATSMIGPSAPRAVRTHRPSWRKNQARTPAPPTAVTRSTTAIADDRHGASALGNRRIASRSAAYAESWNRSGTSEVSQSVTRCARRYATQANCSRHPATSIHSTSCAEAKQAGDFLTGASSVGYLFAAVVARRYRDAFATALAPAQRSAVSQVVGAGLGLAVLLLLIAELEPAVDRGHLVLLLSVAVLGVLAVVRLVFGARRNESWYAERQRALEAEVQERTLELAAADERLAAMVNQDPLTGLMNRRGFDDAFRRAWASGVRLEDALAVLVIDVDRFKEYNDALGHPAGDACLWAIATILKEATPRASDVVARYGGEEFVILCPHTDAAGAVALAERVVSQMRAAAMPHPNSPVSPTVSVSVGAAAVTCTADRSAEALLAAADAALYEAKRGGRDRAVVTLALPAA
jgi:diguanylate cyclase (GGDEF)-like protein